MSRGPGRPRRASAELLQEAAFELFQHRGYRRTSVELIARTAGFSRATFFNFFPSKAELFWVETDELIATLGETLELHLAEADPPELRQAILDHTETLTSASIPWALQNYRLMEAETDLVASGAGRVLALHRLFQRYLGERESLRKVEAVTGVALQADAAAATALFLTALLGWIDAGPRRGSLRERMAVTLYT